MRPGSVTVDTEDCWSVIQLCSLICQYTLKTHLNVLTHSSDMDEVQLTYLTQFDTDVRQKPSAATEKLKEFSPRRS